jgi:protein-L-isoaspartate(D-aspartate) O-methyltransferase
MTPAGDQANQQMVDRLIAEGTLWSPHLIAAFRATPRHRFIDRIFHFQRKSERWREILTREPGPQELRLIYADRAIVTHVKVPDRPGATLPISSSSQPSLMAQMLEDLDPRPGLQVLEIGAGTGYNAALLAHAVQPGWVITVDVDRNVLSEAWAHLRHFPQRRIQLKHADGREGYLEKAPYDRIMVTAATPDLEPAWLEQVNPGGLVVAPLALAPGLAYVACGSVQQGVFSGRLTRPAYFMPLRAEGETGNTAATESPPVAEMETIPSPWRGFFERRRPRASWAGFIQSLAFWGLLQGKEVHYQALTTGETAFGVSQDHAVCWLGAEEWLISGPEGRELGLGLWRTFLEVGGPRPIEFRLCAWAKGRSRPLTSGLGYSRQGPRCSQFWSLLEPIERYSCP